jgi:hypothetical protein
MNALGGFKKSILIISLAAMPFLANAAARGGSDGGGGNVRISNDLSVSDIGKLIEGNSSKALVQALIEFSEHDLELYKPASAPVDLELIRFQRELKKDSLDRNLMTYLGSIDFRADGPCEVDGKRTDGSFNPGASPSICISGLNLAKKVNKLDALAVTTGLIAHEFGHAMGLSEEAAQKLEDFVIETVPQQHEFELTIEMNAHFFKQWALDFENYAKSGKYDCESFQALVKKTSDGVGPRYATSSGRFDRSTARLLSLYELKKFHVEGALCSYEEYSRLTKSLNKKTTWAELFRALSADLLRGDGLEFPTPENNWARLMDIPNDEHAYEYHATPVNIITNTTLSHEIASLASTAGKMAKAHKSFADALAYKKYGMKFKEISIKK